MVAHLDKLVPHNLLHNISGAVLAVYSDTTQGDAPTRLLPRHRPHSRPLPALLLFP
jgi:hypothetical protein